MGWRWRKSIGFGGARTTITSNGLGFSYGIAGIRVGRSPTGNFWVSFSIPGTGISFIKYLGANNSQTALPATSTTPSANLQNNSPLTPNQKLLEKMKNIKP